MIVGISGVSGSGKSTLADALSCRLLRSCVVSLDAFYKEVPLDEAPGGCWESPALIDFDALAAELDRRAASYRVVIVEGFVLLASARVADRLDLCVVLECPQREACRRRLQRDARVKGDPANSEAYFDEHVWPAHVAYVRQAARAKQHLVLDATQPLAKLVDAVCERVLA